METSESRIQPARIFRIFWTGRFGYFEADRPALAMQQQSPSQHPSLESLGAPRRPGTVFVVDDESMVTSSLQAMLSLETPHQIYCFNTPREALEQLDVFRPDVVISDFLMPEMDGIVFLQRVKERFPEATTILLTGYADKENAIQAINKVGIYRYIEKPWDNEELKITIENGLERARLVQDLKDTVLELTETRQELETYSRKLEVLVEARTHDLQVAYQQLESIFTHTADGIVTLDANLCIATVNPAAGQWITRKLGMQVAQGNPASVEGSANVAPTFKLEGLPVSQIFTAPGVDEINAGLAGHSNSQFQEALMGDIPVEVSFSTLPDGSGYVLVLRDIAKRKEIDRLRDDFVSTLTHDLRTPLLAAIQTLTFMLDRSLGELSEKQEPVLETLVQSHKELLGLVNALLEVYKYEAGRQQLIFDAVDLRAMVDQICKELAAMAHSKQQTLENHLPATLPTVTGDKQELRRVLVNLIGNALRYTPQGSHVQVLGQAQDGTLTLTIADNGRGIPAEDLPKLFQRFSQGTSRQRSSGSGLGLYLSRQIVEAHGGRIRVESVEGQGCRFSVLLPVVG